MSKLKEEKTLVLIKPNGVKRGLTGEIIRRIEQRGLKIIALDMIWPEAHEMDKHYPKDENFLRGLGEKSLATYLKFNLDVRKELGTADALEIGKMVRSWLLDYMTSGPVVKMIVQGLHAVEMVRKLSSNTRPAHPV